MEDSRTKRSIMNISYGAVSQFLTLMLNFISRTIFIKILGSEYLGINGLFSDVLSMLCLADLGLNIAMVYSFYKPLAEKDYKKISALVSFYKTLYRVIAVVIAVLGLALIPFLDYLVNLNNDIPYLKIYYLFFLANTVMTYLFVYKTSILTADQKNYIVTRYQIITNIFRIVLQCVFLIITKNYFIYLTILLISSFLNNFLASRKASKTYLYLDDENSKIDKKEKKEILENIKSVFIYKMSNTLIIATDNTLISVLVGTIYVGLYSNYYMVINSLTNIVKIFYNAVTASVGNVNAVEESEKKYSVFQQLCAINLIITPTISVCLISLFNDFIRLWIGNAYVFSFSTVLMIVLNFYISIIQYPVWVHREALGIFKKTKYVTLIAAIINIILSLVLGIRWGVTGILAASAISRLVTYFWYEPIVLIKDYMENKVYKYFRNIGYNIAITTLLGMLCIWLSQYYSIQNWMAFFIKALLTFVIVSVILICIYWHDNNTKMVTKKIIALIKR